MNRRAAVIDRARQRAPIAVEARSLLWSNGTPAYQYNAPQWSQQNHETYRRAFASQVAVYACILRRAQSVAEAPLKVYREEDGDPVEQPKHELRYLFARPNPMTSESEFHALTLTFMDACGFAAIEKVRSRAGNVVQLWHLRADWIKRIPREQRPDDYEYHVPGRQPITLKAEDVLIVPGGPSTDLSPFGMSPITAALREIGINDSTTNYLKMFLDGGAVPRQAIVYPRELKGERGQVEADAIKERWQLAYGGFQNWTNVALLHGGMDVKQIGTNLDEMAYPQLRALTETRICAAFGVPAIVAGIQAGLDASTYSNYEQARKAFFEDTVSPLWKRLAGAYERTLLYEASSDPLLSLAFDTANVKALQEDASAIWSRVGSAARDGLVTLNQFQSAVGLPGFGDAGDVLYLPFSAQPTRPDALSLLADQAEEPPAPVPEQLQGDNNADTADTADDSGDAADPPDGNARSVRAHTVLPVETRSRIARNHRITVTKLAGKHAPLIRAAFQRQGEKVAAAIKKRSDFAELERRIADYRHDEALAARVNVQMSEPAFALTLRDLSDIDWNDLDAEMQRVIADLYANAGKTAYGTAKKDVGTLSADWSLSNPRVRQTQRELARRIVGINRTTKDDVARLVTQGIEDGLRPEQIADTVRGLYDETYRNRSLTISRTESQVAYNISTADAYKESGRVMAMICHDNAEHDEDYGALDGLTCAQRDGLITDVDGAGDHIYSEHPNGTLAVSPLLVTPLGTSDD